MLEFQAAGTTIKDSIFRVGEGWNNDQCRKNQMGLTSRGGTEGEQATKH